MPILTSVNNQTAEAKQKLVAEGKATHNPSVWAMVVKADRIISELVQSRTANNVHGSKFDTTRFQGFVDDFKAAKDFFYKEEERDWVQTHPDCWLLPDEPILPEMDNEDVLVAALDLLRTRRELVRSNSTRDPGGFKKNDAERFDSFIAKVEKFVKNYIGDKVKNGTPDYVETGNKVPNTDIDDGKSTRGSAS